MTIPSTRGYCKTPEDAVPQLWEFIQNENAVVCQPHLAGHRHPPPPDDPHEGERKGVGDESLRKPGQGSTCILRIVPLCQRHGAVDAGRWARHAWDAHGNRLGAPEVEVVARAVHIEADLLN